MPDGLEFLIIALATWRLALLLVEESGPGHIMAKLRSKMGIIHDEDGAPVGWPDGFWGKLLGCVWCSSVWVAIFIYVLYVIEAKTLYAFVPVAASGLVILLQAVKNGKG